MATEQDIRKRVRDAWFLNGQIQKLGSAWTLRFGSQVGEPTVIDNGGLWSPSSIDGSVTYAIGVKAVQRFTAGQGLARQGWPRPRVRLAPVLAADGHGQRGHLVGQHQVRQHRGGRGRQRADRRDDVVAQWVEQLAAQMVTPPSARKFGNAIANRLQDFLTHLATAESAS